MVTENNSGRTVHKLPRALGFWIVPTLRKLAAAIDAERMTVSRIAEVLHDELRSELANAKCSDPALKGVDPDKVTFTKTNIREFIDLAGITLPRQKPTPAKEELLHRVWVLEQKVANLEDATGYQMLTRGAQKAQPC